MDALRYFGDRLNSPWLYQLTTGDTRDQVATGIRTLPSTRLLAALV